ncbi:MAG: hypothetical protein ABEJ65_05085 [bacterium]
MTVRRFLIVGVVILAGFLFFYVGNPFTHPLGTPKKSVNHCLQWFEEGKWNRLYGALHPDLKKRVIPRLRSNLQTLLKEYESSVQADSIDELNDKQVFRTYMQSISQSAAFKQQRIAYHQATVNSVSREDNKATVKLTSPRRLRISVLTLKQRNNRWLVRNYR